MQLQSGSGNKEVATMEQDSSIFNLPTDMMLKIFNERLSLRDINNCSLVCWRWHQLTSNGNHWRKWIQRLVKKGQINGELYKKIAHQTSWKTAYLLYYALSKFKCPQFWNDIALFQLLQEHCFHEQTKLHKLAKVGKIPSNGAFWALLQLRLTNTGLVPRVTQDKVARRNLRTLLLLMSKHFGTKYVLEKMKEIAAVPSRMFFMSESIHVSSLLLQQVSSGEVCIANARPSWPPSTSLFFDWKKHFVAPVQVTVMKILRVWAEITCARQLSGQHWLTKWLTSMGSELLWADKKLHEAAKGLCTLIWHKLSQSPVPLHIVPLSTSQAFLDKTFPAKELAIKLSSLSYSQFLAIPYSDLLSYMLCSSHQWSCETVYWFEKEFGECLKEPIVSFCSRDSSKTKKVLLVKRMIAVAVHLKTLRDFRTLKTLVSAVRAVMGQTNITGLAWKDLSIKYCKMFMELESIFDVKTSYTTYHKCLQEILASGLTYVPYLPAHRHVVKYAEDNPTSSTFSESILRIIDRKHTKNCESELSYPFFMTFNSKELTAAEHVLHYLQK